VAKQISNATCWALDSCWNIMGIIIRIAVMMNLNQDTSVHYSTMSDNERQLHRRLWTIICYMDAQLSLITGQPSLLPLDLLTLSADDVKEPLELEECWTTVLPQLFPVLYRFLSRLNSPLGPITYDEILYYNSEIRLSMQRLGGLEGPSLLRLTLDIFFRRSLMVLHRQKALDDDAPNAYPTSYWSSLECSLAILVHHRSLSDVGEPSDNVALTKRPFMLDFFAAAMTASIHLLRYDAPLAATLSPDSLIPPRKTIVDTLLTCREIMSKEKDVSVCFRTGYHLLNEVLSLVPGMPPFGC
jgi:hypothetical protein